MWFPLAFLSKIYKLSLTKLKHNFKKDMLMFNISEIVKKTEEMFDLFKRAFLPWRTYPPNHHRIPGRRARRIRLVQYP